MKTDKKLLSLQRRALDRSLRNWFPVREQEGPASGWLRAVRGALGLSTRQLARILDIQQSAVTALENRETQGKATLETLQKAANAMECKLIYAIVPGDSHATFEDILDERAEALARTLLKRAEHSMRLEKQGSDPEEVEEQVRILASELKAKLDARLWD